MARCAGVLNTEFREPMQLGRITPGAEDLRAGTDATAIVVSGVPIPRILAAQTDFKDAGPILAGHKQTSAGRIVSDAVGRSFSEWAESRTRLRAAHRRP
jgi:hypothetical protein